MSYNRKRFTLSDRDSLALESRHLLTTAHVATLAPMGPFAPAIQDHGSPAGQHTAPLSESPAIVGSLTTTTKTFASLDDAARDWGTSYNMLSINANKEYGSTFYQNADGTYSYTDPAVGTNDSVTPSPAPAGVTVVGKIHSHAAYDPAYGQGNEHFSSADRTIAQNNGLQNYLTVPRGELLKYDVGSGNEVLVSSSMPKDPNDPN